MNRRAFLRQAALAAAALQAGVGHADEPAVDAGAPQYRTTNERWQHAYDSALAVLAGNVRVLPRYDKPVLIEGSEYAGIWQECGPHESLVYRRFRPDVARNTHMTFFALQREDGQLPADNKMSETGFGQIQMVVPIAATALEVAAANRDDELLTRAYAACTRWDAWLMRYRNTRGTGLIEGFCTYDTGHDNSPRWAGMPRRCPDSDARKCAPLPSLPRLCPDLSATVYGGRLALAKMAALLGKSSDAAMWQERAETVRKLILAKLFVEEDAAFYDLDAQNHFVRIDCDILSRVCGEHVVEQRLFDTLWERQLHNAKAFWAPYPLPSVALNDPQFVRPIPRNSWGGATQALTALRAGRWFEHYNRAAEFSVMMEQWCEAMQRDPSFRQQMDPQTGEFTQTGARGYSPAALVMVDYTWRLSGVREEGETLEWSTRPGHVSAQGARFAMRTDEGRSAEMVYSANRGNATATLRLDGRELAQIEGGAARLITRRSGEPVALLGIHTKAQTVRVRLAGHRAHTYTIAPNQRIALHV
jgi:hypothetical protein